MILNLAFIDEQDCNVTTGWKIIDFKLTLLESQTIAYGNVC